MRNLFYQGPTVWEALAESPLPLVLYGSGDGACKLLDLLEERAIRPAGIFVSDDFVRPGKCFRGYPLRSLAETEALLGDFVIAAAFGSPLPALHRRLENLALRHPLFIPDLPVAGEEYFDRPFFEAHLNELQEACLLLSDERSREVFRQVVAYKLSGLPQPLFASEDAAGEGDALLAPGPAEHYLDLGAYRGDTLERFLRCTGGSYASLTAVEPDPHSFRKLSQGFGSLPSVRLFQAAVGEKDGSVFLSGGRGRGSHLGSGQEPKLSSCVQRSVDSLLEETGLPLSLLKADVEGAEAAMLLGARASLSLYQPKLVLACYHRSEDLFRLPLMLHELLPEHRLFLRRTPCFPCWELNLYALP